MLCEQSNYVFITEIKGEGEVILFTRSMPVVEEQKTENLRRFLRSYE